MIKTLLNNPIVNSILLFLTTSALLYVFKPKFMFDENNKMKPFGYGEGKTCFTFPVVVFGTTLVGHIIFKLLSENASVSEKTSDVTVKRGGSVGENFFDYTEHPRYEFGPDQTQHGGGGGVRGPGYRDGYGGYGGEYGGGYGGGYVGRYGGRYGGGW